MHYLFSVYFVNQPLHVSGIFVAHHREYAVCVYVCMCVCVYIYIYIYIYIYAYSIPPDDGLQMCVCIYMYIYIYIHTQQLVRIVLKRGLFKIT